MQRFLLLRLGSSLLVMFGVMLLVFVAFDYAEIVHTNWQLDRFVLADDLAICTYADESLLFSYRRGTHRNQSDYGRQISAIVLT